MLISGDLASTGSDDDLSRAHKYILSEPGEKKGHLSEDGTPTLGIRSNIIIVPGNHDRFQNNSCLSAGRNFEIYFNNLMGKPYNASRAVRISSKASGKDLFLVIGDFSLRKNEHSFPAYMGFHCGQGQVYEDILNSMKSATADLRNKFQGCGVVWVSHFPPTGKLATFFPELMLNAWPALIESAQEADIDYILSGHIHIPALFIEQRNKHKVTVLSAGAMCTYKEKAGNWIRSIEFDVEGGRAKLMNFADYKHQVNNFVYQP